jgi:hypothetical protein
MKTPQGMAVISTALLLVGVVAAPVSSAEPNATLVRIEDAVGDTGTGKGPDIVALAVSQPEGPLVSFSVEFASDPPLTWDLEAASTDMLMIAIATQAGAELPGEADYVIGAHGANLTETAETGAHLYTTDGPGDGLLWQVVDVAVDGTTVTLTLDRHLLGDPEALTAVAHAAVEGPEEAAAADACPDTDALAITLAPTR